MKGMFFVSWLFFPSFLFAQTFVPQLISVRSDVQNPQNITYLPSGDKVIFSDVTGAYQILDTHGQGVLSEKIIDVQDLGSSFALMSDFSVSDVSGLCSFRVESTAGTSLQYTYNSPTPLPSPEIANTSDYLTWIHGADDIYIYSAGVNVSGQLLFRVHDPLSGSPLGEVDVMSYFTIPVPAWKIVARDGVAFFVGIETGTNTLRVLRIQYTGGRRTPFIVANNSYSADGILSLTQVKVDDVHPTLIILGHDTNSIAHVWNINSDTMSVRHSFTESIPLTRITNCGTGVTKYRPITDSTVSVQHIDANGNMPFSVVMNYSEIETVRDLTLAPDNRLFMLSHINNLQSGDINMDGTVDLADIVFFLSYLFQEGEAPQSLNIANVNGDDVVNIADAVYLINYLFIGGPAPVELPGGASAGEAAVVRSLAFPYMLLCLN